MLKKFTKIVLVVLILGALIAIKMIYFPGAAAAKVMALGAAGSGKNQPPMKVKLVVVNAKDIQQNINVNGLLRPFDQVDLVSEVSAKIDQLKIKDGAHLTKGQVLVELYKKDIQAQLEKLQIQEKTAEITLNRALELRKLQGVSQQELDNDQLNVDQIKADIKYQQELIKKYTIRAPFTATAGLLMISEGALVNSGVKIATIQRVDKLKLDFSLAEADADLLSVGDSIHLVDVNNKIRLAKVVALDPALDASTRTRNIRAELNNPGDLHPGSFTNVNLMINKSKVLMVPTEALTADVQGSKLWLIKGGQAHAVYVQTGIRTDNEVEIITGIKAGDSIVNSGLAVVHEKQPLTVLPEVK